MFVQLQNIGELIWVSKIANAFENGKAFIGFLTAGDPTVEKTVEYILAMEEAGCDLIEIGIPFSDPMAEGVVIQDANVRALKHNTTKNSLKNVGNWALMESFHLICLMRKKVKFLKLPEKMMLMSYH